MWNRKHKAGLLSSLLLGGLFTASPLYAWEADYFGELIEFDEYDFAPGAVVLENFNGGNPIQGHYQSYLSIHTLEDTGVFAENLNITGTGDGYEITIAADFTQNILGQTVEITGGTFSIYLDESPDYDFNDNGTFTDGTAIIVGDISGSGLINVDTGIGVVNLSLNIDTDLTDEEVFKDQVLAITGGESTFTLQNATPQDDDLLLRADGNLQLVPIPAAVWLFGSALLGFVAISRRQKV